MAKKKKKKALKKALKKNIQKNVKRFKALKLQRSLLMLGWLVCAGALIYGLTQLAPGSDGINYSRAAQGVAAGNIRSQYLKLSPQLVAFANKEKLEHVTIVSNQTVEGAVGQYKLDFQTQNLLQARLDLNKLTANLAGWNQQLNQKIDAELFTDSDDGSGTTDSSESQNGLFVPILLYHVPPPDLETQLQYLADHGYTSITPDQLAGALYWHETLPSKPVMITFDDGFEEQMQAFTLLQKYNMKATFYIITGGANSNWCIGANRTNTTCGQPYLTWSQIKQLDKSGLITIGCHTVDHLQLATLTDVQQTYEISTAKDQIQEEIGHSIDSFAYPYGSYNQTTIQILASEGFTTAVTTNPGSYQSSGLTLFRTRAVYGLP
jgi:peptidoglycan/xylan/chitin deacetylase (PgdA/CDA1 family)